MTTSAVAEDDPDAFPRPFGQYLLLENFARGGMGEVYLAKSGGIAGLEKYCVLKKLRSELTRDREYVTRFIDEARVVVTLQHANICHVFDVGRVGDEYYLAMEYISGRDVRTLQDRCRTKEKPMAPANAMQIVCETLESLDYAHRRAHPLTGEPLKLVHRDVSPQNVLVSYEGEVKLIDFGLAASKLKVERTQPNVVMGKMAYMAPEQARGDAIDMRADLFACGVMLYELIAGERFYEGMSANDIWNVAGKGGFTPRKWDQIDRDLAKHLAKALHPDPKKRFATCGDFREALASHLHWRFPGSGVRGLREMMAEVFATELNREREMLAKFGKVTVAGYRTEFESTQSHSVSLARADETSPTVIKAQLVRNEQTMSSGAVMPGPASQEEPPLAQREAPDRDVHQDPTRIAISAKNAVDQKAEPTQLVRNKDREVTSEQAPREPTMRIARARGPSGPVKDRTALVVDPSSATVRRPGRRTLPFVLAAAVVLVVLVVAAFMFNQNDVRHDQHPIAAQPALPSPAPSPPAPSPPTPSPPTPTASPPAPQPLEPPIAELDTPSKPIEKTHAKTHERKTDKPDGVKAKTDKVEKTVKPALDKPTDATPPPPPPPVEHKQWTKSALLEAAKACSGKCDKDGGEAAAITDDASVIEQLRKCVERRCSK